jgi:DNA-binding HxlR family transcriptional regulator
MAVPAHSDPLDGARDNGVCPFFHQAVELVGKRWTGAIVQALLPSSRRFSELAQAVPEISDRLLCARLRELEMQGLVVRQVLPGSPVRVVYALTPKGRALEPALRALHVWGRRYLAAGAIQPTSVGVPPRAG